MKIIFMGTPSFALPSLKGLIENRFEILLVITQLDRPGGRGMKPKPPEVKLLALQMGLLVYQPLRIKEKEVITYLQKLTPEAIVIVAYGQILSPEILGIPKFGCINLHASLLPDLRGAAPIPRSIILGRDITGVTTMYLDEGMDTGDIILQKEVEILADETAGELSERLATIGADLLLETMRLVEQGKVPRRRQDEESATYAPAISKEETLIDWTKSAREIHNLIRGLNPLPGAYSFLEEKRVKIYRSRVVEDKSEDRTPGRIVSLKTREMVVACGEDYLSILELQPEGKRVMDIRSFLVGHKITPTTTFGKRR